MHASCLSESKYLTKSKKCPNGPQSPLRITKVWNELPDSVVNMPQMYTHLKTGWTDTGGEKLDFLYNYEAPVPGHHLAEDRAKRFEHCGHEAS